MKLPLLRSALGALFALAISTTGALAQAQQIPAALQCFQATTGVAGMIGSSTITAAGTGGTAGTYGGVALTGGSGTGATANVTVSGGAVTGVAILNPGANYVVADTLSAASGNIGGVSGFVLTVNSIAINSAVAGGSVGYYIPSTLTPKATWQDAAQTIPNTNPVLLDQNGCAIVYGSGTYRQILQDSLGNTVWDQPTTAGGGGILFWCGSTSGSANAQACSAPGFSAQDGQQVAFVAGFTNSSATTLNANATGPLSVVKDTPAGSLPLSGGDIVAGNVYQVTFVASTNSYHMPVGSALPVGSSIDYTGPTAPAGWLFENGACVSQTTYAALYAITGAAFGSGCSAGSFQLPDYRGRVGAGVDNMGGSAAGRLTSATMSPSGIILGAVGGIEGSAITIGQMPLFTPTGTVTVSFTSLVITDQVASSNGATTFQGGGGALQTFFNQNTATPTTYPIGPTAFTLSMDPIGSGQTYYVVQPTLLVNKIIKF